MKLTKNVTFSSPTSCTRGRNLYGGVELRREVTAMYRRVGVQLPQKGQVQEFNSWTSW